MEPESTELVELELKYCERCGGLWLRECGVQTPYCTSCVTALADCAVPRTRKRPPRLPANRNYPALDESIITQQGGVA